MKIIIVNTSDISGGAARAAYRLHRALLAKDIESRMMVQSKVSDDLTVLGPETTLKKGIGRIRPKADKIFLKNYPNRTKTPFSPAAVPCSDLIKRINETDADVVHLHWIAGGAMKIEDIKKINKPIVWSLHDMWAFTGGCHYTEEDCKRYTTMCGSCPVLGSHRKRDLSNRVFKRKQKTYRHKNLTIVGLSSWLASCARESSLLKSKAVVNLPNPIDTDVFRAVDKQTAREMLGIPSDRKLVLFGAMSATSDPRKGFSELTEALHSMEEDTISLMVFGSEKPTEAPDLKFPANYMGRFHDDISLTVLYSAADVMVVPSILEAFGQTASEAMACNTPVVAFGATGLLDIVDHKENGYLAQAYDSQDLAEGIRWVLKSSDYDKLCRNARKKVVREFDSAVVAEKYIALYEEILST